MDRLYDALDAFSSCTGIPVTVYDTENRITREFNAEQKVCRLFPHFSQSEGCQGYLTFSMDESFALGEPYIFFCPAGFVEIAVPILYNGARRGCVLAGPLVLGSVDEKLLARIMELNPDDSALFPRVALFLQNAKESTPEQIQKIATLLYASVLSSRQNWEEYEHIRARSRGQISAGETVQQFKLSVSTGGETEETLWQRLLAGLRERDREAVNEAASGLFDEFLLVEAGNFDLIRMRLIELFTMLSKAALDSGINLNKILAAGLDPLAREEALDILRGYMRDERHGILMSSHITSDLEKIADYIVCIDAGRIVFAVEKDTITDLAGIAHCRATDYERIAESGFFAPGELRSMRHPYGIDVLAPDRFAFAENFKNIPVDKADIDVYMGMMLKGEVR